MELTEYEIAGFDCIYKNILHYMLYLLRKNENTIVKQAFRTSLELYYNGKNSFYFYHNLIKISE